MYAIRRCPSLAKGCIFNIMNVQEKFGHLLRTIREAKEWRIEDLSESSGLHYTYISDVERGRRNVSLKTILAFAKGLGVPPSILFPTGNDKLQEAVALLGLLSHTNLDVVVELLKVLVQKEAKRKRKG